MDGGGEGSPPLTLTPLAPFGYLYDKKAQCVGTGNISGYGIYVNSGEGRRLKDYYDQDLLVVRNDVEWNDDL